MKLFITFFAILVLFQSVNADDAPCFVEGKKHDISINSPVCIFYTGTEHYRNERYDQAMNKWEQLFFIKPFPVEHERLLISASNNLGYLYYHGLGKNRNTQKALEYWERAVLLGHEESEYHLCYALGDPESPIFSKLESTDHCKKAFKFYNAIEDKSENDLLILKIIKQYL